MFKIIIKMTSKMLDTGKVLIVTASAITIGEIEISIEIIKNSLTIASIILAMSYTVWKWVRDIKKGK